MFLGAKVFQALLDNFDQTDWRIFTSRIDQLHHQIQRGFNRELDRSEIEDRLAVVMDLGSFKFITSDSPSGYALTKHAAPLFWRAASCYPSIWTLSGSISLPDAISLPSPELSRFVWTDNLAALVFGTEPFFRYDANSRSTQRRNGQLEWVYGCPEEFMVLLGQITALRSWSGVPSPDRWSILASEIRSWTPSVDQSTGSCAAIARLTVHECWRHALLIYLYLAVYRTNSADSRVVSSVRQIIQLLGTVKIEDYIDRHLFVPCLIAGISSRKEVDRALVRERVAALSATKIWVLQGADFTSVLDHLWHGSARDGRPVGWEDYVRSRRRVLPVDEGPL
ncbi:Fungal specific transcription factor domain [Ceratobasidium sp. AG-Ba]|nr:Fungal specific transcription factor domain [Ceratobasidium sp. AG-Ba]